MAVQRFLGDESSDVDCRTLYRLMNLDLPKTHMNVMRGAFDHTYEPQVDSVVADEASAVPHVCRVNGLDGKRIVNTQPSFFHSLALSDNGCVKICGRKYRSWSLWTRRSVQVRMEPHFRFATLKDPSNCGGSRSLCVPRLSWPSLHQGQLGQGHKKTDASMLPTAIPVFQEQNIKITTFWQLTASIWRTRVDGTRAASAASSKEILIKRKAVDVKCGSLHSLSVIQDGTHFLFGRNNYNQVTFVQSQNDEICRSTTIDSAFSQRGL